MMITAAQRRLLIIVDGCTIELS